MSETYQSPAEQAVATPPAEPPFKWTGSRFKRVRENAHLFWPSEYPEPQHRGAAGYVIDTQNELEARWCRGQEFKLEDCDAKEATTIDHQIALGEVAQLARVKNPPQSEDGYRAPAGAKPSPSKYPPKPKQNFKEIEA